jgi:hypothetical protein
VQENRLAFLSVAVSLSNAYVSNGAVAFDEMVRTRIFSVVLRRPF